MRNRQNGHPAEDDFSGLTLMVFCASWCSHCLCQRKALERARRVLGTEVSYGWIDIEAVPGVRERYSVEAIPMILLMRNGHECLRLVGVQSEETILESVHASEAGGSASYGCGGGEKAHAVRKY
jgi:thioredoxin-like negative regulator of GroEL